MSFSEPNCKVPLRSTNLSKFNFAQPVFDYFSIAKNDGMRNVGMHNVYWVSKWSGDICVQDLSLLDVCVQDGCVPDV